MPQYQLCRPSVNVSYPAVWILILNILGSWHFYFKSVVTISALPAMFLRSGVTKIGPHSYLRGKMMSLCITMIGGYEYQFVAKPLLAIREYMKMSWRHEISKKWEMLQLWIWHSIWFPFLFLFTQWQQCRRFKDGYKRFQFAISFNFHFLLRLAQEPWYFTLDVLHKIENLKGLSLLLLWAGTNQHKVADCGNRYPGLRFVFSSRGWPWLSQNYDSTICG